MESLGLYVHVPFCLKRCAYCDFCSSVRLSELGDRYISALKKEISEYKNVASNYIVDTVYIGGGTPSILPLDKIEEICNEIYKNFSTDIMEFTIEVNPSTAENIKKYAEFGINRISMGVQSLNDCVLKELGRIHDRKTALDALKIAAENYENVSADLILGVSKSQEVTEDIALLSNFVKHLSIYMLQLEEGTKLYNRAKEGLFNPLTDDETVIQYEKAYGECLKRGFYRYEVSNFAREGFSSKHNRKYWSLNEYLGFGASAHSLFRGKRFYNEGNIEEYIYGRGRKIAEDFQPKIEEIFLALRTEEGLNVEKFEKKYGVDFSLKYAEALKKNKDFVCFENGVLKIKKEYFLVQNGILSDFI